jgi:Tfp pilus assembly protein PilF
MDWQRQLTAAQGYLELGMGQDAWDELEEMPARDRARSEVVIMRLVILQSMARWDKAAEIARGAVGAYPDCSDLYLIGAYAIRRAEDVRAAFEFLQEGCTCLVDNAAYWFNRGCYLCQLGEMEDAKMSVRRAVDLDKSFQQMALDDEDLEPLWDQLGGGD